MARLSGITLVPLPMPQASDTCAGVQFRFSAIFTITSFSKSGGGVALLRYVGLEFAKGEYAVMVIPSAL